MSERNATTWTCDRCGWTHEESGREQPLRWSTITIVSPPRAEYDPKRFGHKTAHLCHACTADVLRDDFTRSRDSRQSVAS